MVRPTFSGSGRLRATARLLTSPIWRTRAALQLEILALRHQIGVLQCGSRTRPRLGPADRLLWAWLSRVWVDWRHALMIVKPETVLTWYRKGFRSFWTFTRGQGSHPSHVPRESLWGAPRIPGELLKLGIDTGETSVDSASSGRASEFSDTLSMQKIYNQWWQLNWQLIAPLPRRPPT